MGHYNTCPLCSSPEIKTEFTGTDYFLSKENFPVCRCNSCGFVFTQDHPEESEAARYYDSEEYVSHSDSSEGIVNSLYMLVRDYMMKRKAAFVRKAVKTSSGRLLDIGSGTGYFLRHMRSAGWEVTGIEINQKARESSSKLFGLQVLTPEQSSGLVNGYFDCITLWHVLEHFQDPGAQMKEISRLLKPGGSCIIALPNCSSLDAVKYKEYWAAWDLPRHLWHFTPDTFRKFAKRSGFAVTSTRKLPFDVFYISAISEKYKGSKSPFIKGMLTGLAFWLLSVFDYKKASSLVYLLKRPE